MLTVKQVVAQLDQLAGTGVELVGTLVAVPDAIYLVEPDTPPEAWESTPRLLLEHDDLLERLFEAVPVRVGGPFYYYDEARLLAEVQREPTSTAAAALRSLKELTLSRASGRYDVPLGSSSSSPSPG
jgi:hypothetical protein